jgi:beta-glucuronidase
MKAYPHYHIRRMESLNEFWDFAFYPDLSMDALGPPEIGETERILVPGAFDVFPAWLGKRGTGVYSKRISVAPGTSAMLEFEAVSFACRVWVDGECLAEHFCGYSPFEVRLPVSQSRERMVIVQVENRFDFERIPMHEHHFDFRQYGGIIRPVWLHHLPEQPLEQVRVDVLDAKVGLLRVSGRAGAGQGVLVEIQEKKSLTEANADSEGHFSVDVCIAEPKLWTPESPSLYHVRVSNEQDDVIHRIGLRSIETRGREVLLNGKPIRLWGYNRHEFHPNFGPSTPEAQQFSDIQLFKDCGCNFVRGSHYPQSQLFLDLCDELGLLVWEENLGWGQGARQVTNARFLAQHQQGHGGFRRSCRWNSCSATRWA